ncbi:hypothetical protein CHU98_g2347 [Xylaria longipes]|nr:hypothetical protein CHU98_g2347 [Xylaria longipes]
MPDWTTAWSKAGVAEDHGSSTKCQDAAVSRADSAAEAGIRLTQGVAMSKSPENRKLAMAGRCFPRRGAARLMGADVAFTGCCGGTHPLYLMPSSRYITPAQSLGIPPSGCLAATSAASGRFHQDHARSPRTVAPSIMSRRYDSRTTIFSPEGRLYQVEYALEAISHAGTAIGILAKDGIVLAAERKVTSKLLEQDTSAEKLYILNDNMICAVAGMTSDANILINYARQAAQRYLLTYNEDIPCEQLVRRLCDLKQGYTQHGGLRPFGVSFIYAGWDPQRQFQLYLSNPSGNYGGWKATSAGANKASADSLLKQDYKEDCTLKEACGMAVKVLSKTMDSTKLSSEKIEFATVGQTKDGKIYQRLWSADEITALLKEHDLAKDESADDK